MGCCRCDGRGAAGEPGMTMGEGVRPPVVPYPDIVSGSFFVFQRE